MSRLPTATAPGIPPVSCCAVDSGPIALEPTPDDLTLAAMAKALGHPTRLRIIRLLLERTTCVTGEMVAELPLAQSTVSEHLRVLRAAGLIQGEIEGQRTSYCISPLGLAQLKAGISSL
ncbi:MAG: ArsR/SmtB family transcription factor [Candidatus Dormibacteria bacterium]